MKKITLLLMALLMFGTAQTAMAQNRKPNKRTTTTSQRKKPTTTQKNTTTETYPAVVNGHLAFMGISLAETPATFKKKLLAKGFRLFQEYEGGVTLKGLVNGVPILVNISNGQILINDQKSYQLSKAKARFHQLVQVLEEIYGKGTRGESDEYSLNHKIKVAKGFIEINMFNEDEMDGSSDYYMVNALYQDIGA